MKARYGSIQLTDGAFEGPSGFSLNGQQVNDRLDIVRALAATFVPRGNRSATLSFSVTRQRDSLHASERHVLEHFWQLPEQADLLIWIGTDDDGEWVKFSGAVIDNVPSFYRGVSPGFQYSFSVGIPAFEQPPPDVIEPDDSMIKRGTQALDEDDDSKAITFTPPFAGTPVCVPVMKCPNGGAVITCQVRDGTESNSGFTVDFSAPIPGSGYKLNWIASA